MKDKHRVLLIDDDLEFRGRMEVIVNQLEEFRCVASYSWGTWKSRKTGTNHLQVAVAGIRCFDTPTRGRLLELRRQLPGAEMIVFCEQATLSCLRGLLALGINSVVIKGSSAYDLTLALLAVRHGGAYFSPGLSRLLAQAVGRRLAPGGRAHDLTVREREVWEGLAHDKSNKEIASRLKISPQTVETHVRNLYRKLGCGNRKQARALHWNLDEA